MTEERRYVGVKENLAYGFANAGQVFGYNLVAGGYLSLFFIKVFGIPEKAVATMILILGIWDTINDPVMGGVIDRTRTKYGKLRPYLLFVPIPLAISTIMLFAGPEILKDTKSTVIKIVYMYVSYFIWEFLYTIGDVPFWGMSTAISPSTSDRTRAISTARFLSSLIGGLSLTFIAIMMDLSNNKVWSLTLSQDFLILAIAAALMLVGLFSLAGRKTRERVVQSVKEPSVIEGFKVMVKNKPLLLIIIGNILGSVTGIAGVFQTYYYSEVLNLNSAVLWISLPGTIFGFLTYLLIPKLKKKLDNRQIVLLNIVCRFVVGTLVFISGLSFYRTNILVISILLMLQNFIFSFFNTINMVIPTEMIGDTVDYMEWKTGERNEGVSFAVLTFVAKLTGSVSTSLATAILPVIGLSFTQNPDGTQTTNKGEHTDLAIWACFTIVPWILGLFSIIPYLFYNLTGKKLEMIREEMTQRRQQLTKEVSSEDENHIYYNMDKRLEEDAKKAQREVEAVYRFVGIIKSSSVSSPALIARLVLFFTPLASMCLPMYNGISLITIIMGLIKKEFSIGDVLMPLISMGLVILISLAVIISSLFSSTKNGLLRNMVLSVINLTVFVSLGLVIGSLGMGWYITLLIYLAEIIMHIICNKVIKKQLTNQ